MSDTVNTHTADNPKTAPAASDIVKTYRQTLLGAIPEGMIKAAARETGVGEGVIDWVTYLHLQDKGLLWVGGMFEGDSMAGVSVYILGPDTKRAGEMVAHSDCLYIQPAQRHRALSFVRWCCAQLTSIGCNRIYHSLPQGVVFGHALVRDGHRHMHSIYVMECGNGRDCTDGWRHSDAGDAQPSPGG